MSKPIKIEITGDATKFEKTLTGSQKALDKFGKAAAIGVAALGTAGLAVGAALFTIGSDFDAMRQDIIKGTGATGEALDALFESSKTVMSNVPDSGAMVATTLADVNTFFGSTGAELEGLTESMLDFSRLTGTDVGANVEALDGIMTSFGMSVEDSDELMGDLIRTSQATGVPMDALIDTIDKFGPSFEAAGMTAEQAAIMVGEFAMAGVDAEATGKILDKVLLDAAGNGISAEEAMANLDTQLTAMTSTERLAAMEQMVGGRNASAALAAWENGALSMDQINASVAEGAGVLDDQTAATASFSDKWNEFKNKVLVKLEPLATKLFDKLTEGMEWLESDGIPAVEGLVETFRKLGDWVTANKDYIIAAFAALGVVLLVTLGPAMLALAVSAGAAAVAMVVAAAPFIALAAVAVAVALAIVWLWKNWDDVWAKIKDLTGKVVDWLVTKVSELWDKVKGFFSGGFTAVRDKVSELWDKVKGFFSDGFNAVRDKVAELWTTIKNGFTTGVDTIVTAVGGLPGKLLEKLGTFLSAGKDLGSNILQGLKDGLSSAVGFAGDLATSVKDALKGKINTGVIDKINSALEFTINLPFGQSFTLNPPDIPRLFKGVDGFTGGVAMVGEHGRELVSLPGGANVLTNRNTEQVMAGGNPSQTFNVHVKTDADPHDIARELAWAMRKG